MFRSRTFLRPSLIQPNSIDPGVASIGDAFFFAQIHRQEVISCCKYLTQNWEPGHKRRDRELAGVLPTGFCVQ